MKFSFIIIAFMAFTALACRENEALGNLPKQSAAENSDSTGNKGDVMAQNKARTDEEWKKILTPEQYSILREKGTEQAFTGAYWDNHEKGVYRCAACGTPLFKSDAKFESGTGWPSFWEPASSENVTEKVDRSLFMMRTEVLCSVCGGHLGHLFDDGPQPSGLRYCINSAALKFVESRDSTEGKK